MTDIRRVAILCAVLATGIPVGQAQAQAPVGTGQQDRAVFQGDQQDRESRQVLQLTGSFSEAYDDNLFAETPNAGAPASGSGFYSVGEVGLFYGRASDIAKFSASGGLSGVYYPDLDDQSYVSYRAGVDGSRRVNRTQLSAYANANWLPYFLFGGFPAFVDSETLRPDDPGLTFSQDLAVTSTPAATFSVGGRASQPLSRRVSIEGTYDLRNSNTTAVGYSDQTEQGAGVQVDFQVTRYTSLRGSYSYRLAEYERGPVLDPLFQRTYHTHEITGGVEHTRPLSSSRSLMFAANVGSSINDREALVGVGRQDHYYRVVGNASLGYDFSRDWGARVEARRSLEYLQGFLRPYFANGVSAIVGGLLTRELQLVVTGRYSNSPVAFEQIETGYDSGVGSVLLQYGFSRNVALRGEYVYYQYAFGGDAIVPPGFQQELKRQVVRVGVTFGAPLYREQRRP